MQAALFARLALNPSSQQLSSLVHELESRWPDKDQHVYLFARGVLSLSAQKPNVQVALDYFLRSLESHPKILILPNGSPVIPARTTTFDALLFYYIAEAYRQNNQYKECLMYADLSALCNQKWGKAWELRGKASLALRKFDQALISFRYAQSLNPDDIGPLFTIL
jgi:tetratricopeptide (TPR) repeat protein